MLIRIINKPGFRVGYESATIITFPTKINYILKNDLKIYKKKIPRPKYKFKLKKYLFLSVI